jgi:tetratricopeptide (TPR) repeat protein
MRPSGCRLISPPLCLLLCYSSQAAHAQQAMSEAETYALESQQHALAIARTVAQSDDPLAASELAHLAIEAAERALALDSKLDAAYSALALVHRQSWRWSAARHAYERAYALEPNDPQILFNYAWFNSFSGRHEQAIRMAERSVRLNPNEVTVHRDLGIVHAYAGNAGPASDALRRCIALDSAVTVCHIYLAFMQTRLGNHDEAARQLRTAEQLAGEDSTPATVSSLAHGYSRIGRHDDAARLFARLESMASERVVGTGTWPLAYLALGDTQSAFEWLGKAVAKIENHEPDEGFFNLMIIKANVLANPVLDEPRFVALRERIGAL